MTAEQQLIKRIREGNFATIGEYRFSKAEMLNWRDKQTGQARSAPVLRHTIELGNTSVAVSEALPAGVTKIEDVPQPKFAKGQEVILIITELARDKGLMSCRGSLEPIQNGEPSPGTSAPVGGRQNR